MTATKVDSQSPAEAYALLLELERTRARATADLAARMVPTSNTIGATVVQTPYQENSGFVAVHLDGDPPGANTLLPFTGPWSPYVGERCLVLDTPNGGLTVIGPTGPTPTRTWTPTVSGGTWALGNGTVSGNWERVGNWAYIQGNIAFGSTSVFGGGSQLVIGGLPLPARNAGVFQTLPLYCRVGGGSTFFPLTWRVGPAATSGGVQYWGEFAAPGAVFYFNVVNTGPATWVASDFIDIGPILYPVATNI